MKPYERLRESPSPALNSTVLEFPDGNWYHIAHLPCPMQGDHVLPLPFSTAHVENLLISMLENRKSSLNSGHGFKLPKSYSIQTSLAYQQVTILYPDFSNVQWMEIFPFFRAELARHL
jgi:hypothetical protein